MLEFLYFMTLQHRCPHWASTVPLKWGFASVASSGLSPSAATNASQRFPFTFREYLVDHEGGLRMLDEKGVMRPHGRTRYPVCQT